jgi:hypothetical protein
MTLNLSIPGAGTTEAKVGPTCKATFKNLKVPKTGNLTVIPSKLGRCHGPATTFSVNLTSAKAMLDASCKCVGRMYDTGGWDMPVCSGECTKNGGGPP